MRITAGKAKGLRLKTPASRDVRPMTERARKALFDILGPRIERKRILDLFSGTGAVGLEALSRGAGEVVFVDASPKSLALIRENLRRAGFESQAKVLKRSLPQGLKNLVSFGPFDLVFVTPPYGRGLAAKVLEALEGDLLVPEGLVIVEEREGEGLFSETPLLTLIDQRRYGQTELFFYRRR